MWGYPDSHGHPHQLRRRPHRPHGRDQPGRSTVIETTSKHPFWDATDRRWVPASKLTVGHTLTTASNERVTVEKVRVVPGAADMYNLTVDDLHTYYVLAGDVAVLVHNDGDVPGVARIQNLNGMSLDDAHDHLEKNGYNLKSWSDGKGGKGGCMTYQGGDGSKITIRDTDGRVTRTSVIDNGPNKKNGVQRWDQNGNKILSHDHGESVTC
ncbi:polymorphic toxin-type HINT domain-containing protein [Streptomyces niveus]|uniref:polymorphic toxin-type HINT domain-containing protein n=1 Tax=Streptomyces niveus TaxID=193462 RepID=UPI00342A645D